MRIKRALIEALRRADEHGRPVCSHETPYAEVCPECLAALREVLDHDDAGWWIQRRRWSEYRYLREALGMDCNLEVIP